MKNVPSGSRAGYQLISSVWNDSYLSPKQCFVASRLGPDQTSNFTYAESNATEVEQ